MDTEKRKMLPIFHALLPVPKELRMCVYVYCYTINRHTTQPQVNSVCTINTYKVSMHNKKEHKDEH